jgi:hypothetical protein
MEDMRSPTLVAPGAAIRRHRTVAGMKQERCTTINWTL